uniref:Uncharacterized protein n=1 Tax=Odontella aurita TaxID=265563 RepID=A0A7S4MK48_9STRA
MLLLGRRHHRRQGGRGREGKGSYVRARAEGEARSVALALARGGSPPSARRAHRRFSAVSLPSVAARIVHANADNNDGGGPTATVARREGAGAASAKPSPRF